MVKGYDATGCANTDTVTVNVGYNNKSGYFMPTAFSPNGDGLNDCFGLRFWGTVTKLDYSIYNRFGQRIFYSNDAAKCWDGKFKGVLQNIGVYVYVIEATTTCGEVNKKGTFVLMR
jgi:gliding motility-associated-like protein